MGEIKSMLTLSGVSKHFGGATALSDVSITFEAGKIHSLVGENGAGKSTLGKILLGVHQPDEGTVSLDNQTVHIRTPALGNSLGLVGIAQELSLLKNRTVTDNIALGREVTRGPFVDAKATRASVINTMERYDMHLDPDALAGTLPMAEQQKVEILRALNRDARLIVFDEPTARLASHEAKQLLSLVKRLAKTGKAIVYVSHFLEEVLETSDHISILRNGKLVRTADATNETCDTLVMGVTGQKLQNQFPSVPAPDALTTPVLKVESLSSTGLFEDVTFDIRPGEILGLSGLVGAGRSDLALSIYGALPATNGRVTLGGQDISNLSIRDRIIRGMAFVPESRRDQGLMMHRSILENASLPHLDKYNGLLGINKRAERTEVDNRCQETSVKHDGLNRHVETLSGGNQQKILFARAAIGQPSLLIADEPTRGVDVGAKRGIYDLIASLAAKGEAILLISSEIEEIMGLSHRVLVMSRGKIAAELSGDKLTEKAVMEAAFSGG